jgi:AcrR family transcriptional regulator
VKDVRVRRTQRRLREALVSLIHEKSYPAIAVSEILERADVGRSAFYAHFPNKDALLASGIEHLLHATPSRQALRVPTRFRKVLRFSFPVFEYVGQCRHNGSRIEMPGRLIVHEHLRDVLVALIHDDVEELMRCSTGRRNKVSVDILTDYIVSTFMLVLNRWVDNGTTLSPMEVDDVFLSLVVPTLASQIEGAGE